MQAVTENVAAEENPGLLTLRRSGSIKCKKLRPGSPASEGRSHLF